MQINYSEGNCIAIPLRDSGYARGVITRMNRKGVVFGYFFAPKIDNLEDVMIDESLYPENAVLSGQFGDLGLLEDKWKVVGGIPNWSRDIWIMPSFLRLDEDGGAGFIATYDEDSMEFISEEKVRPSQINVHDLPEDSVMGYGFVEVKLTKKLSE